MAKTRTIFVCQNCGSKSNKWMGRCNSCNEWNTLVEELDTGAGRMREASFAPAGPVKPIPLDQVEAGEELRFATPDPELNRVLGGGIVAGSLVLLGGEPGIGKSTLLLQTALHLKMPVWYISGEESDIQIRMRAERLQGPMNHLLLYAETELSRILRELRQHRPPLVIVDSIQTLYSDDIESAPGSVSQIRHCASLLMRLAKEENIAIIMVGHITKDGSLAGPKVLEHTVDTVLQFEGDRHHSYRILRTLKNRFGSTAELGLYEMLAAGMQPILNPSEMLLSPTHLRQSGMAVAASMEGNRPMLIEVQMLVSKAAFSTPQRSATGFDSRRLNMLLAVLEKRIGLPLGNMDVFLNITGGLRTEDPAVDLAVCLAAVSSYYDLPLPASTCFAAEVGLGGELRPVSRYEQRQNEAQRLGFPHLIRAETFGAKETPGKAHFQRLDDLIHRIFKQAAE